MGDWRGWGRRGEIDGRLEGLGEKRGERWDVGGVWGRRREKGRFERILELLGGARYGSASSLEILKVQVRREAEHNEKSPPGAFRSGIWLTAQNRNVFAKARSPALSGRMPGALPQPAPNIPFNHSLIFHNILFNPSLKHL